MKTKRTDEYVPDYDYLFSEDRADDKKQKTRFLKKILRINVGAVLLSTIVYVFMSLPLYVTPIVTSNVIDLVTSAVNAGADVTIPLIINVAVEHNQPHASRHERGHKMFGRTQTSKFVAYIP